jgi:hypothetical protein
MPATPLEIFQHNERIKGVGSILSNGGLALFGAFSAVIYGGRGTDSALGMAFVGLVLMFVGSFAMPKLLREEET